MADSVIDGISKHYQDLQAQAVAQRASASKDASLGMADFITLLVAQLQNQDMMNPMNDTEFISQMAQFSMLQSINTLTELDTTSYALSLIGKEATAAAMDSNGKLVQSEGIITGVTLFEGKPIIYIGDRGYGLESLMTVGSIPKKEETPPEENDDPEKNPPENGKD